MHAHLELEDGNENIEVIIHNLIKKKTFWLFEPIAYIWDDYCDDVKKYNGV